MALRQTRSVCSGVSRRRHRNPAQVRKPAGQDPGGAFGALRGREQWRSVLRRSPVLFGFSYCWFVTRGRPCHVAGSKSAPTGFVSKHACRLAERVASRPSTVAAHFGGLRRNGTTASAREQNDGTRKGDRIRRDWLSRPPRRPAFARVRIFDTSSRRGIRNAPKPFSPTLGSASSSIHADINDDRSVAAAVAAVEGVVNAVSLYVESGQETFRSVHVTGAARVRAARPRSARQAIDPRFRYWLGCRILLAIHPHAWRRRNGRSRGLSSRGAHPPFRDVRARRRLRDPGRENVAPFTHLPPVRTRPNATATSSCRRRRRGDRQGDTDRPAPDVL